MEIEVPRKFKKVMKKKEHQLQAAIASTIHRLSEDVAHPGLRVHKMGGHADIWEAYVDKANRVTFKYEEGKIVLLMNCNHDMLRKNPGG